MHFTRSRHIVFIRLRKQRTAQNDTDLMMDMQIPEFFQKTPRVLVYDPLAKLLGAPIDGFIEYNYVDAVKLAGHSCPTVAGGFLTGRAALAALYPDGPAERGQVRVYLPAPEHVGTTGVTAQILTLLTGAAAVNGFKGLGGLHARNGLLHFAQQNETYAPIKFERIDTGAGVSVHFDPSPIPMEAGVRAQLIAILHGRANEVDLAEFGRAWQTRVCRLLLQHADDPAVVQVVTEATSQPLAEPATRR